MLPENTRILQIGKFYPVRGGVEKVMYDLMLGLAASGIRCDMLCAAAEGYKPGTYKLHANAELICVPVLKKAAATMLAPAMISTLRRIMHRYNIIHIHHPDPMACLALWLCGYKGQVVLHWHADILKQKKLLKLYSGLQAWLIKRAAVIVGTTPVYVQASPFLAHVQHKVTYIPIGVLPIVSKPEAAAAVKHRYAGKTIIFSLGRLVAYKGYEYLINAAAQLNDDYVILIGGKGPLYSQLQHKIAGMKLQHKVQLLGYVSDDDIAALYTACDVFCLSSITKNEAFGIVQIEAMSAGKPVVCTLVPGSGLHWVNKNNESGLVVPAEDAEALAAALKALGSNTALRHKLGQGALQRYTSNFTIPHMVNKCISIYSNILQPGGTGPTA